MVIATQGPVSFSDLQTEFGGSNPISMSEYYRSGAYVPSGTNTLPIPASGKIDVSDFKGTTPNAIVTYEIIGGGGAGGFGVDDGGEGNRGTYGQAGGTSSLSGAISVTAAGGAGGENCGGARATYGTAGQSSYYGAGGAGGVLHGTGGTPASTSYGAAGGGGGGDSGSTFDAGGCSGFGGLAGTRATGTAYPRYGTSVTITIGAAGITSGSGYPGGSGAGGYAKLIVDGVANTYTSSNTLVIA